MSSPLSKAPDGLLGTLDLKNLGHNPAAFGDVLEPSLEVLEWYLLRNRVALAGSGPWVAVGTGIVLSAAAPFAGYFSAAGNFVVPQQETIRIKSITITVVRAAADAGLTLEYTVFIRRTTSVATVALGTCTFGARPATDLSASQALNLTQPLWLGPGDFLRVVPSTTQTAAGSNVILGLDLDTVPSG